MCEASHWQKFLDTNRASHRSNNNWPSNEYQWHSSSAFQVIFSAFSKLKQTETRIIIREMSIAGNSLVPKPQMQCTGGHSRGKFISSLYLCHSSDALLSSGRINDREKRYADEDILFCSFRFWSLARCKQRSGEEELACVN